jgi:hypothetical protein
MMMALFFSGVVENKAMGLEQTFLPPFFLQLFVKPAITTRELRLDKYIISLK